jgi:hypothetical protein
VYRIGGTALGVLLLLGSQVTPAWAQTPATPQEGARTVGEAFRQGTPGLAFRYRYEYVDQDGIAADAHASTLRTALSFRTASLHGFDFLIEAENVVELGDDWYRDAGVSPRGNGVAGRPVVADPAGTDINQVALRYRGFDSDARVGRQEINIADQRFVGAVGWRQHHQTFTAFNVSNTSVGRLELQYVFSNNVYRVFGDKLGTANNFVHASIDAGRAGTVRAYAFLLDYSEQQFANLSTNSFGAELLGSLRVSDALALHYEAEYAHQVDAARNPNDLNAEYAHLMGGLGVAPWATVRAGWELLGAGENGGSFATPLATLHKFNGWADKFLSTPPDGLRDLYLQLNGAIAGIGWMAVFHDFNADSVDAAYGSEFDWQLTWVSGWQQTLGLKGAYYSADAFATDTLKIWVWTEYAF